MKRVTLVIVLIVLSSASIFAQDFLSWQLSDRYFSVQVGSGTSTYYGDLKHTNNIRRSFSNLNLGVEARLLSKISARVQATYFDISGSDATAKDSTLEQQRNLSFYSKNWEINFNGVFYLNEYRGNYYSRLNIEPYLFAGIGATFFNPKTKIAEKTISLSDFKNEGKKYSTVALALPVGMGLKFKLNTFMNFNLEASYRFTFTDYLDDVSQNYADSYPDFTSELVANRKDEIAIVNQEAYDNILVPGGKRGDSSSYDSYLFLNFQIEFYLPADLFSGERPLFKKGSGGN
ncbi:MAG: outer membrane beta-barrel protein [Cyclobacteriaceae bacterium]